MNDSCASLPHAGTRGVFVSLFLFNFLFDSMCRFLILSLFITFSSFAEGQSVLLLPPYSLPQEIGTAHFSGITPLGNQRYAVVSDKEPSDGFFLFRIEQSPITGAITEVHLEGFRGIPPRAIDDHGYSRRDAEDIAFFPGDSSLWICGEGDQVIEAYTLDGHLTSRRLAVPDAFSPTAIYPNRGFEALAFDPTRSLFWTTTESTLRRDGLLPSAATPRTPCLLRLQTFDTDLRPVHQYAYRTDPASLSRPAAADLLGVPALCVLPDGRLLVMEREGHFPSTIIGAWVKITLYAVQPSAHSPLASDRPLSELPASAFLSKQWVTSWTTRFNFTRRDLANYEGLCLGARLPDGRQTLLCINDSQAARGNALFRLKDYLRVVVLPADF